MRSTRTAGIVRFLAFALALPLIVQTTAGAQGRRPVAASKAEIHGEVQAKGLRTAAVRADYVAKHRSGYAIQISRSAIRDQEESGRCWAFAWTRTLQSLAQSKGVKAEAMSPSFINYYALRGLAYGAINHAGRIANSPERNRDDLSDATVSEGGYSHWASEIVKRHGIAPETKMSSGSFDSRKSHMLQNQLHRLVSAAKRDIWDARDAHIGRRQRIAREYKQKVDELLDTMIGAPPTRFVVDGKTYTPQTYRRDHLKLADKDLDFVNLTNDPRRAWNRRYQEAYPEGVPDNHSYNVPVRVIEQAARKTLKRGIAPNVAVNVDWDNPHRVARKSDDSRPANGILSLKAFDYGRLVPAVKLSKYTRMYDGVSMANHMMAITGYNPKRRGEQARWLIDNSHGAQQFRNGQFDMDSDFFRHYVEEVTVPRSAVPKGLLKKMDAAPPADAIDDMTVPPSKNGQRWTAKRREALVEAIIRQDLDIQSAAKRYHLPVAQVHKWYDEARQAMMKSLR